MKQIINVSTIVIVLIVLSCQSSDQATNQVGTGDQVVDEVILNSEQLQVAQIKTSHIQKKWMGEKIRVNGLFHVPPQNKAQVSSLVDAFVKRTTILVGDKVNAGQTLVWLHHPEIINLQNDFVEKHQKLEFLRSEYERQRELDKNRINAKKNLLKAEFEYKGMKASVNALKENLRLIGIDPNRVATGRIYREIGLRSPIDGYITKVNISLGSMVEVGQPIFEIINPEHLHIELKVFEKDVSQIKVDEAFTFKISGDTSTYFGKIHLVGQQLNEDRTVDVHGHVDESSGRFISGMYVEADVYVGMDSVNAIPEAAIFERDDECFVFLVFHGNKFKMREIVVGKRADGWAEILEGKIGVEDDLVIQGVYFLSSMI